MDESMYVPLRDFALASIATGIGGVPNTLTFPSIHQLDKLTLAFRRPLTTPPVPSGSIPPPPGFQSRRDAFGLSFVSSTALRVVKPPLALTPAILQVVRSAWPLGVVNEKRESDGSFLFKLKVRHS
ncbi:hypothetical protein DL93DRAFT_2083882 [Clavulina sp. PMI_390]|nr:hypothetical protein DL93DRAFT_2083882 [Clavulina sp. PMI_390]